jgi:hypothetical protein
VVWIVGIVYLSKRNAEGVKNQEVRFIGPSKYNNCGKCSSLPCKMWYDLKDPSLSEEEHINSINERTNILKKDNLGKP